MTQSRRDRHEAATIKRMLAEHHARSCVECILIGEQVYNHLERKALPRGEVQRYTKEYLDQDAEYLRRFIKLHIYQDETARGAEMGGNHRLGQPLQ